MGGEERVSELGKLVERALFTIQVCPEGAPHQLCAVVKVREVGVQVHQERRVRKLYFWAAGKRTVTYQHRNRMHESHQVQAPNPLRDLRRVENLDGPLWTQILPHVFQN